MASLIYGLAGKLAGELLSPLFKDYVGKPWELGTKSEFEKIKSSVSAIEAVLLDAEEKQRTNRQVQDWLKKIKRVFYDLEDLLQEVRTEDLKRRVTTKNKKAKKVRIFFSSSNQLKFRFKMGRKVKKIRERLDAIASDRSSFGFTFTERKEEILRRRVETHSFMPIDQFVGRLADKECVTKYLLQPHKVSVISIIGIGGIGKTALAQSIYDSEEVKRIFDLRMWVCVSVPFDVKKICENIIESATGTKCDRLQMDGVKGKLKKAIGGRKYLLVLDDVWNESNFEWRNLEVLLACGAEGSKILITARAGLVARASSSIETHVLKGLSHKESWALFKQVAFNQGVEQVNPTMERIGKAVVKKCVGVPLVVKAIGSMLAVKEGESDWLDFEKNDLPRVAQDSQGTVLPILRLSYDNLSAPLKRCFVFCAIYPKDHEIEKEELIGMWMAHGLIQLDGTPRSLEDVGERHFMDLLDRSFFEVHRSWRGTCYKMHDLIHDLAQSVGGDDYYNPGSVACYIVKSTRHSWVSGDELTNICHDWEKLRTLALTEPCGEQKVNELISTLEKLRVLQSVGGDEYYSLESGANSTVKSTRHTWVSRDKLANKCRDATKLHTLVISGSNWGREPDFSELTSKFEQLRVLTLRRLRLRSVPHFVGGLRHLYYLDLSGNKFVSLPESICTLYNLQTLILCGCQELEELPAGIRDLVNLRRLDVSGCSKLRYMPRGLEELTCLQTLILSGCWELEELPAGIRDLVSLRRLDVSECYKLRHMPRGVEELTCLQTLNKFIAGGKREKDGKRKWAEVYELKNLVNLRGSLAITNLSGSKCERNESCILLDLKLVKQLELKWKWKHSWIDEEEELLLIENLKPHPNLERLIIECYPGRKFPSWMDRVNIGVSLPNIVSIKLHLCWRLRHVPALGLLPCLQQLHLFRMDGMEYLIDSSSRSSLEEEPNQLLFPSLKELHLDSMWELKSVVEPTEASQTAATTTANHSRYFPVLEKLHIADCPLFTYLSNEDGKLFGSLLELRLPPLDRETLPSWVQYLPHLQTLKLSSCHRIVSLPEWMGNLTSLQELHLEELMSLASLPDCMQCLTSLQWLVIVGCPKLESRCEKETGVDWHKIAHIPNIEVK